MGLTGAGACSASSEVSVLPGADVSSSACTYVKGNILISDRTNRTEGKDVIASEKSRIVNGTNLQQKAFRMMRGTGAGEHVQ